MPKCRYCSQQFRSIGQLAKHYAEAHPEMVAKKGEPEPEVENEPEREVVVERIPVIPLNLCPPEYSVLADEQVVVLKVIARKRGETFDVEEVHPWR